MIDLFPIRLSLEVGLAALAAILVPGCLLAWLQAHRKLVLPRLVDALLLVPLVLPPSVIGYLLVQLLSNRGPLSGVMSALGVEILLTPAAAVCASSVAAFPLLAKTLQPSFAAVPRGLEEVGASLGLSPLWVFLRITLPSAWKGLVAGCALAFARAVGEFGATLMVAGYVPGKTNTIPLEIYAAYQTGDHRRAAMYVAIMLVFALVVSLVTSAWSDPASQRRPRARTSGRVSPRGGS